MPSSTTDTSALLHAALPPMGYHIAVLTAQPAAAPVVMESVLLPQPIWFDHVNDAVFLTDASWQIQQWNRTAEQIYGWPRAETIGRPISDTIAVVRYLDGASDAAATQTLVDVGVWRGEFVQRRRDGREVVIEGSTRAIHDAAGAIIGYIGINRDMTARYQAEQAVIAEHARVVQLQNAFITTMSHELRTPLNGVLGPSQLLLMQLYGPLNARQIHAIQTIEASGHQLLALVNDVLEYATLDTSHDCLVLQATDIALLCQESVRMVTEAARAKQITLTWAVDPAVTVVQADARRLRQILGKLLANAVKFTPDGGEVGLRVRGDPAQRIVMFTVWDTGVGIAAHDLPRLFQPFVQLDTGLNRAYEGAGLGLALVQRLVTAHGGSVTVDSTVGQGSQFRVTLPWESAPAPVA